MLTRSVVFSYFALFCIGLIDNSRGPIYPEILTIFNLNNQSGSFIFSLATLASFVATILAPLWQFRLSSIAATKLGLVLMSVGAMAFALISYFKYSYIFLLLFCIIFGIGVGLMSITLNIIITENSNKDNRQRLFSGLHSMYGVSSLIAPFALSLVFKFQLSWQIYFLCLAIIPLFALVIPPRKEVQTKRSPGLSGVSKKEVIVFGLIVSCYVAGEVLLSSRLVLFLKSYWGYKSEEASLYLTLFFLFLFVGRLLFSLVNLSFEKEKLLKFSLFSSVILVVAGVFYSPFCLCLSALTMSYFFPCFMSMLTDRFEEKTEALMAQMMNFVGGMLFIGHFAFGQLVQLMDIRYGFFLIFSLLCASLYLLHFKIQTEGDRVDKSLN